ncbi:protein FAM63A [Platysternon megacephalum]|uniref:Protein FAM63A n=1 Tax=Platysternon megacephalum TaxID=55544 RepID=A0A4D9EFK7_9SAUR|nr:protein FAM63A [Platysternon megacephalum]
MKEVYKYTENSLPPKHTPLQKHPPAKTKVTACGFQHPRGARISDKLLSKHVIFPCSASPVRLHLLCFSLQGENQPVRDSSSPTYSEGDFLGWKLVPFAGC